MKPVVRNEAVDYSFFVGVAAGTSGLSAWIWKAGAHRHTRLMHVASRIILAADVGVEGAVSGRNCYLLSRKQPAVP